MSTETKPYRFLEKDTSPSEEDFYTALCHYIDDSPGTGLEKLKNFPKYAPRQALAKFISRYEIFKRVLNVQGSIIECGVLFGGGLMTFAQLSAILEPVNHQRRIIGFDTFEGFPALHEADRTGTSAHLREGGLAANSFDDLQESIRLYDANRAIGHVPKVELVKGDVCETVPKYIAEHPHTVVSLLYLDMDIYKPTKVALEQFLGRIPKGGVVAFDELNSQNWPGETQAVLETVGVSNLRIERFPFDSYVSFAVIE